MAVADSGQSFHVLLANQAPEPGGLKTTKFDFIERLNELKFAVVSPLNLELPAQQKRHAAHRQQQTAQPNLPESGAGTK